MQSLNRLSHARRSRLNSKFLAAVLCAGVLPSLHATSGAWNGLGADSQWSTSLNWDSGGTPPGTGGQTATFNGAGNGKTTIDLGAGIPVSNITFDSGSAAAYTIGAGSAGSQNLTLNSNVMMNATVAANQLFNANVLLNGATNTFTNSSAANSLSFAGGISAAAAGTKNLTIAGVGAVNISGNITDGAGVVALTKSSISTSNTLTLSGTNNFTGAITVGGGSLVVSGGSTSGGAIAFTSPNTNITVSGGSLTTTGVTTTGNSNARILSLTGGTFASTGNVFVSGTAGAISIDGGTLKSNNVAGITVFDDNNTIAIGAGGATFDTTTGNITLGANATLSTANNVTFRGASGNTFTANTLALGNGNSVGFDLSGVTIDNSIALVSLINFTETLDGGTYNFDFKGFNFDTEGFYTLIGFSSLTGTFLADDFVATNSTLESGYVGDFVLSGSSLSYVVSAIPEPSSFAALAGLMTLGFVASRRKVRV